MDNFLESTIIAFDQLSKDIINWDESWEELAHQTYLSNKWFTTENIKFALQNIANHYLNAEALKDWTSNYDIKPNAQPKNLAIIGAGNIPLAAIHDVICGLITGWKVKVKLSEKDNILLPFLISKLIQIDASFSDRIEVAERLVGFDAVIATGSDNSARYFESYFGQKPNIIRKNRNSLAVLTGDESDEQLEKLADDVFLFFGLGCRSVSKILVPRGYEFLSMKNAFNKVHSSVLMHNKYMSNFEYNFALYIINQIIHVNLENIFLLEDKVLGSRIAALNFEYYESKSDLIAKINAEGDKIQCVVADGDFPFPTVSFGESQKPMLKDYADNVDTLQFLIENQ